VVERTLREPPGAVTHWTGRAMASAMGLSLRTVQRIWAAHKLQPHRIRTFKRSTDPDFAARLDDVVGLYMNPPRHAVVVSIDEKSQIQALDRTQPGLPLKRGKCATLTHDYKRNGTTTLFAALSVLEGKVIGRCVSRHRHQEFIRFIATVERAVPAGKVIHAILDNYAAHKHPEVLAWLADHPRWTFHFTPTSCSWLNAVEGFFSKLTRQSLKRGIFRSVDDLEKTITRYIAATNRNPKPFVWTATAKAIRTKLALNHPSESVH
jgi:transposase